MESRGIQGKFGGWLCHLNLPPTIAAVSRLSVVHFHGFVLDTGRRVVLHDGHPVHLTRKAFDVLAMLVREAPSVVSKDVLHTRLWPGTFVTDSTIAGVIKELRRVFAQQAPDVPLIRTVHGVGYAFVGVVEQAPAVGTPNARCWLVSGERRIALADGTTDLGRGLDLAVSLDSREASRRHARVVLSGCEAILEDVGSKNGTWLNGQPLTSPTRLYDGDTIRLGTVVLVFREAASPGSTATATDRSDEAGR